MNKKAFTVSFFLLMAVFALAQPTQIDPMFIHFKARLINAQDSTAVPYATVINYRTHSGTSTNANGYFSMDMLNIDTLAVSSIGYNKTIITPPANYNEQNVAVFAVQPSNIGLKEVTVEGEKRGIDLGLGTRKPVDIHPTLRGNAFNSKPSVLNAVFNPISFWHYYLSKSEKRKRDIREAMMLEKYWEMHSQNYNKEVVEKLTGLSGAAADTFMIWFNAQKVLSYASTEYEVRASIIKYFNLYKEQKDKK